KGHALTRLAGKLGGPLCVAVGDDVTDEDMFEAAAGRGIAIRVGRKSGSKAGYFLRGQPEVLRLLRFIADSRSWNTNSPEKTCSDVF
ncbi:MAG TPA: trehalose-phosphatase, partial [Elusimicrobiales bacterium]|nr:trehalose-phosphatase [Elusimicrobiales bacterium]